MRSRIVVLISGSGTNLQAIIDACKLDNYPGQVVGVISNKADAYGLVRAQEANIETKALSHKDFVERVDYDKALIKEIDAFQPDLVVLAGFMRILTPDFCSTFSWKIIEHSPVIVA